MRHNIEDITTTNRDYYEHAYSGRYFLKALLKQYLSYDQLSKTRRNLKMLRRVPGFSRGISVLDYGFGHGTLLLRLPRRHQISGCELSAEAIVNLRRLCTMLRRNVSLYSPDEIAAESHAAAWDMVCCSHVIEHVGDDSELVRLYHAVLRPGGHLLLNVPINEVWSDPKHIRQYTVESTTRLLERSGFEIECSLQADRWTSFILVHEYVSIVRYKVVFRLLRLFLALLPIVVQDALEMFLPGKYQPQQLLVLAKKI
jgi:2-polyprenyl-3-methyl-5-hydroxy-6-metoxy-1,4-benzoquinol methylase